MPPKLFKSPIDTFVERNWNIMSVEAFEMRVLVERKLNEFQDMLKMAFPELNKDSDIDMKKYVDKKMKDSECYNVSLNEIYSVAEQNSLLQLAKRDEIAAVFYALVIGFTNGVEWERKNKVSD